MLTWNQLAVLGNIILNVPSADVPPTSPRRSRSLPQIDSSSQISTNDVCSNKFYCCNQALGSTANTPSRMPLISHHETCIPEMGASASVLKSSHAQNLL